MFRANGLYGHVQFNKLRSLVLLFGFFVACHLIGFALLFLPLLFSDHGKSFSTIFAGYIESYSLAVMLISIAFFFIRLFMHVGDVERRVNFRLVSQAAEPRLNRIIEMQAIAAGISMPNVGVIENPALNAFACGLGERSATLVVTRGLLWSLDDDELEAVVAHEITHIVNGDMRMMAIINTMLSSLLLVKKYMPFRMTGVRHVILAVLIPPFMFLFLFIGGLSSLSTVLAKLSRLLIASSREFIADAEAVRMTKNPAALVSALTKISGKSSIVDLDETIDAMMIDGAVEGEYASHPTIAERIEKLTQHAGTMLHSAGIRKDSRVNAAEFGLGQTGAFGRRSQIEMVVVDQPKKSLLGRVNTGSDENIFGLSSKIRRNLLVGLSFPVLFTAWNIWDLNTNGMPGLEHALDNGGIRSPYDSRPPIKMDQLRATRLLKKMPALEARCYSMKQYRVGGRGDYSFHVPDKELVKNFTQADRVPSDITPERYAAFRLINQYVVRNAVDIVGESLNGETDLDKALLSYIQNRKHNLMTMHRFFGEVGFKWMHNEYQSVQDKKILLLIKQRMALNDGFVKDKKLAQETKLLIESPSEFVPCYFRAGLDVENIIKTHMENRKKDHRKNYIRF